MRLKGFLQSNVFFLFLFFVCFFLSSKVSNYSSASYGDMIFIMVLGFQEADIFQQYYLEIEKKIEVKQTFWLAEFISGDQIHVDLFFLVNVVKKQSCLLFFIVHLTCLASLLCCGSHLGDGLFSSLDGLALQNMSLL